MKSTAHKDPASQMLPRAREFYFSQRTFRRVGRDWGRSNRGLVIAVMAHTEAAIKKYELEEIKNFRDSSLANVIEVNQLGFGNTINIDLAPDGTGLFNQISVRRPVEQKVYYYSTIFDRRTLLPLSSLELGLKPNSEMTHAFPDTFEVRTPYPMSKSAASLRKLPFSVDVAVKKLNDLLKERNHIVFQLNEDRQVVKTSITPLL